MPSHSSRVFASSWCDDDTTWLICAARQGIRYLIRHPMTTLRQEVAISDMVSKSTADQAQQRFGRGSIGDAPLSFEGADMSMYLV